MRATTAYVRKRSADDFAEALESFPGTQRELAAIVGISAPRLNQIVSGASQTVPVTTARAIEKALRVKRGALFVLPDAHLARPYLASAKQAA